jgi:hypothetical protein
VGVESTRKNERGLAVKKKVPNRNLFLPHESLIHPSRREVVAGLGATMFLLAMPQKAGSASPSAEVLTHSQVEQILKPLLITKDPALWQFAVNIFEHCILGRMQLAEPPLKHPWLVPG